MESALTVYKASAGSGKTFTLAVEYIAQLLSSPSPAEFQHTLAVTFTNKATAEMKDRILQQLYAIAHSLPEGESYYQAVVKKLRARGTELPEGRLRKRAGQVLSAILHDFSHFRVETIDSFFQSILRNLARELGLTANLEVELNTGEVISRAVDRIIDTLQYNPAIQQWILNYVSEQIENNERWDIKRSVKHFARCIFEESFQNRSAEQRQRLEDEKIIQAFLQQMRKLQEEAAEMILQKAKAVDEHLSQGELNYDRISRGGNFRTALQQIMALAYDTEKTTLRNAVEDPMKLLKGADKKVPALQNEAQKVAAEIGSLLQAYSEGMSQLMSARLAARHINPLRLLGSIEEMANRICKENNQFLLSRTPTLLSTLVKDSDAPFVFEKIGTQLHHVMIDEFQDTSQLQWNNFKVLLLENQATGGNDLVVGDVKQSIYRWRNGDWSVLHGIEQEMSAMRPEVVTLDTNYRSHGQVIRFNNGFFPLAAERLDALCPDASFRIADIYADVCQKCNKAGDKGYVSVRLYAKKGMQRPDNYEDRFLGDMISQIRGLMAQDVSLSDMAILVRKRDMGTSLIEGFHRLAPDIRLVSDEAFLLSASVAVQMIVNALRVLADPSGANPVPMRYLVKHYLSDVQNRPAMPQDFAPEGVEACLPQEFFTRKEELASLPLYVLCEEIYRIFGLSEIHGQASYLFAFYDQLKTYLRSHPSDLRSFLLAWDETLERQPISCGQIPGLRIMTIHQSKGLQFHTVLLPYTEWDIEKDRNTDLLWCEPKASPYNGLGLLPVTPKKDMAQSVFSPWYEEEHLQKRVDALNTLYVAFTRAECNLMIWGLTTRQLSTSSLSGDLLHAVLPLEENGDEFSYEMGEPMGVQVKSHHKSANRMTPETEDIGLTYSSYKAHMDFRQSNDSARFIRNVGEESLEGQDYVELGKILHYVLSQIEHLDDVERVLNHCQHQGLIVNEKQRASVLRRIHSGMQQDLVRSWFAPEVEVYNECSIVTTDPENEEPIVRRPDRVIISGNRITVIDFKCGNPWPEHVEQVQGYMRMMAKMYPAMQLCGYLWYIYSGRVQEVAC